MRLLWIGAYDPAYTRHAILREGLRQQGVTLLERALPRGTGTLARGRDVWRHRRDFKAVDGVIVPAFNQLSAPLAQLLADWAQRPLLVDYLVSLTEASTDYGLPPHPAKARLMRAVDHHNMTRLNTFTDTQAHREHYAQALHAPLHNMQIVPVGVRQALLDQRLPPPPAERFVVQYVGTYIPFHSVETILMAAQHLHAERRIQFELIGPASAAAPLRQKSAELKLENVRFIEGYFPPEDLLRLNAGASAFLGVFGAVAKTDFVVPNKVYEGLTLARPVITAQSRALEEFFKPGEHLLTVPPEDPEALAAAIRRLADDQARAHEIGQGGAARIRDAFTPRHIAEHLLCLL